MKLTSTIAKLFSAVSTLAVVAGAMGLNGLAMGQAPWYIVLEQTPNPAVITDAAVRQKIVDTGFPWRIQDIGTGIEMLIVPPGIFQMGASPGDNQAQYGGDEFPSHQVTLSKAFYLGRTEVSQSQWQAQMGFIQTTDQYPVASVSWNDIQDFNARTGLRLPTEAEWECACRGGSTASRYGVLDEIAWYKLNSGGSAHAVASKIANGYGFYDMLGNLFEWVQDYYGGYATGNVIDPIGPIIGSQRVLRGGDFLNDSFSSRSSRRFFRAPTGRFTNFGFRVARTPEVPSDLDGDGIPDATDNCPSVANSTQADCDGNGVGDACELDCNHNGIADICEIRSGAVTDQNLNGIPDTCEVTTVTRVQPISGPSTGGTAVRIFGTNFFSALPVSVTFGGAPATNVVVVSLTEITAVTPSGNPGDAFVAINGAGAEEFYYRPSCDGDLDNNRTVDSADLSLVLLGFGDCSSSLTTQQPQEPMIFPMPEAAKPVAVVGAMALNDVAMSQMPWYTVLEQAPNDSVVLDADVRARIIASGFAWRVRDNSSGIEMILIPSGIFIMGCSSSDNYSCFSQESPNHEVTLSKAFYLGKTEVTQAQWQAQMGNNPSNFKSYPDSASRPVEQVSWNDIIGFNIITGLRLPTEAEWEYACRGFTTTALHSMPGYPNGTNNDNLLGNIAWYASNSGNTTHAVGGKAANAFGLHDVLGNVYEWCSDWYNSAYYITSPSTDPEGPSSDQFRVIRGGSWTGYPSALFCRSSNRFGRDSDNRESYIGFRVARTPLPIDPNDLDSDGVPNGTDNCPSVANSTQADCDGNGVGDACEPDCNHNGIADVCEMLSGGVTDQNLNGIPDTCEVATVTRVLPMSGPSIGGTTVKIIGTNFFSALPVSVTFGGAPATNVVVVSLTEITAVTPSGNPGDAFVAINGAGAEEFYYRPSCDGDLDNNGTIDSADLSLVLLNFGDCSSSLTTQQPQEPMIFLMPESAKAVAVKK